MGLGLGKKLGYTATTGIAFLTLQFADVSAQHSHTIKYSDDLETYNIAGNHVAAASLPDARNVALAAGIYTKIARYLDPKKIDDFINNVLPAVAAGNWAAFQKWGEDDEMKKLIEPAIAEARSTLGFDDLNGENAIPDMPDFDPNHNQETWGTGILAASTTEETESNSALREDLPEAECAVILPKRNTTLDSDGKLIEENALHSRETRPEYIICTEDGKVIYMSASLLEAKPEGQPVDEYANELLRMSMVETEVVKDQTNGNRYVHELTQ